MVASVASSCGDELGIASSVATPAASLTCAGSTEAMPLSARMAAVSGSMTVASCEMSMATTKGPLTPGPKPSASRSYARRCVRLCGSEPSSGKPRRSESTGAASARSAVVTPIE